MLIKHLRRYWFFATLFIGLYLCGFNLIYSQEPYYKNFGIDAGIPSINIYDLFIASDGLLYLGTEQGLFSFDGINFNKFEFVESLAVGVNGIIEDEEGRIWCKNFSSQIFYTSGNKLILEQNSSKFLSKSESNLSEFTVIDKKLYLATEFQVVEIDQNNTVRSLFHLTFKDYGESITSLIANTASGKLHIGTTLRIITIEVDDAQFKNRQHNINTIAAQKELMLFRNQIFFISKGRSNFIFDSDLSSFAQNQKNLGSFIKLSEAKNRLWLSTSNGAYALSLERKTIGKPLISNIKATDVISDQEGNIWVSSIGQGLFFIPNEDLIKIELNQPEDFKKVNFTTITKDEFGHIFAGSDDGRIVEIDKKNQHTLTYNSLDNKEIEFIKATEGVIYSSRGIFLKSNPLIKHALYLGKDISFDDYGNILVAAYNIAGIMSKSIGKSPNLPTFLLGKLRSTSYSELEQHLFILKTKRTRAVHYDPNTSGYYVGNSDGLFLFSEKFNPVEIRDRNNRPIIAAQFVRDDEGFIWVATIQQGLFKIKENSVVEHLNKTNGLPNNQCKKLRIARDGIWLLTDGGLHLVNRKTLQIKHISTNAGFDGLLINDIEIVNNKIYLATNDGVLVSSVEKLTEEIVPIFEIKESRAFNQIIQSDCYLKYNQNNLTFKLQAIHFRSLGNYEFQYRLLGLSEDWSSQSAKIRDVKFLALKPGSYTFEARLNVGDVLFPIERFSFVIGKPFWITYWFAGLVLFFFSGAVYLIFQFQVKKIKSRQSIREQLALSQITALRTQMNPHFMFNILNAFQGLIYTNQKTKANEYLGVFSDLMRKTLDISDQREITIYEELEAVELYVQLEEARFESGDFEFNLEIENREELQNFMIPSLILQPFIENAIKHGLLHKIGAKKLELKIYREGEKYWCFEIEDNGIGREKSIERNKKFQKHKSFATKSIDSRIALINKLNTKPILLSIEDLKDEYNNPCGTRVILRIPYKIKA